MKKRWRWLPVCRAGIVAFLLAWPLPAQAGWVDKIPFIPHPARIDAAQVLERVQKSGDDFADVKTLEDFYAGRTGATLWTGNESQLDKARAVEAFLQRTWTHGLNPASYHVTEIGRLLRAGEKRDSERLELLLSDGAARYGHDISGMRLKPAAIGQDAKYWRKPLSEKEALEHIAQASDPAAALAAMAPQNATYHAMQNELVALTLQERDLTQTPRFDFGGRAVPGRRYGDIEKLRTFLGVKLKPAQPDLYDAALVRAVMDVQRAHGLNADGIIGAKTLAALSPSPRARMEQLAANLERMRWMDQRRPDRYVLVNIPSQMLWAVDKGKVAMQMAVVAGQVNRPTKAFKTEITGIRFNPRWTVPQSIKMKDFLPILVEDPTILERKGIALYRIDNGRRITLDPMVIDWRAVTSSDMNRMHMVQRPGNHNSLGLIRVLMPNEYDIYLHDTNHRDLFEKTERFLSSGCVRLSDPVSMARFVLEGDKVWSDDDMRKVILRGKQRDVLIPQTLPIYITYLTVWQDGAGRLVYGQDIYGQDRQLIDAMKKFKAIWLPDLPKIEKSTAIFPKNNSQLAAIGNKSSIPQ